MSLSLLFSTHAVYHNLSRCSYGVIAELFFKAGKIAGEIHVFISLCFCRVNYTNKTKVLNITTGLPQHFLSESGLYFLSLDSAEGHEDAGSIVGVHYFTL